MMSAATKATKGKQLKYKGTHHADFLSPVAKDWASLTPVAQYHYQMKGFSSHRRDPNTNDAQAAKRLLHEFRAYMRRTARTMVETTVIQKLVECGWKLENGQVPKGLTDIESMFQAANELSHQQYVDIYQALYGFWKPNVYATMEEDFCKEHEMVLIPAREDPRQNKLGGCVADKMMQVKVLVVQDFRRLMVKHLKVYVADRDRVQNKAKLEGTRGYLVRCDEPRTVTPKRKRARKARKSAAKSTRTSTKQAVKRKESTVVLQQSTPNDAEAVAAAVDRVAKERSFVGTVQGCTVAQTQSFISNLTQNGGIQMIALDKKDKVVGWCDAFPNTTVGMRHVCRLGMGVVKPFRRQGLGQRLLHAVLRHVFSKDCFSRVELELYASERAAIALCEKNGFVHEGRKRRARILDGKVDDVLIMGLLREDWRRA